MIKLHLVGFTTDLKNLIFARRKGAKTGAFLIEIDTRLRRTLDEVARLEKEGGPVQEGLVADEAEVEAGKRSSKLTPKEIQKHLRIGKTAQEVARMAETDVSWIERFTNPIIEERSRVVDAVKSASITKARLGKSVMPVGDSIVANLRDRRVSLPVEILDEGWTARLRDGKWEVTFTYLSRGQGKDASFSFDPETRQVEPLNGLARELAWRSPNESKTHRPAAAARTNASKPASGRTKAKKTSRSKTRGRPSRRRPRSVR
jgi:hypothetical protein